MRYVSRVRCVHDVYAMACGVHVHDVVCCAHVLVQDAIRGSALEEAPLEQRKQKLTEAQQILADLISDDTADDRALVDKDTFKDLYKRSGPPIGVADAEEDQARGRIPHIQSIG